MSATKNNEENAADPLRPLVDIAKRTPGNVHVSSVWRWCRRGVRAADGMRIFLRAVRLGRSLYSRLSWLEEFGEEVARHDVLPRKDDRGPLHPADVDAGQIEQHDDTVPPTVDKLLDAEAT